MYNFVDVSGVGNSGKTAVSDILREFDRVWVPADSFEFDFFRLPNGVLDLHHHLAEDWSPIRSHYALKRFIELADYMASSPSKFNIYKKMRSTGHNYDRVFNNEFSSQIQNFVKQITAGSYRAEWPYELVNASPISKTLHKLAIKFDIKAITQTQVYLSDASEFEQHLTTAMNKIYQQIVTPNSDFVVLHNCFEPFNPARSLNVLSKSKSIIVYRDPRDVYVAGIKKGNVSYKNDITFGADDEHGLSESFLATYDINLFILRYQTYMKNIYKGNDSRVLKIRFEDLVTNYEKNLSDIYAYLKIDPKLHINKGQRFKPQDSIKNIGKWKKYQDSAEIKMISEKLSDFVWNN